MSHAQVVNTHIRLAFIEGQLTNAVAERARWADRELEARNHREDAFRRIVELRAEREACQMMLAPRLREYA